MSFVEFFVLLTNFIGESSKWVAISIFITACITNKLDGTIARKYNLVTNIGKFMASIADKLLVSATMICLIEMNKIPAWIAIKIISREFIISGFRLVAANNDVVIAASYWAKLKQLL